MLNSEFWVDGPNGQGFHRVGNFWYWYTFTEGEFHRRYFFSNMDGSSQNGWYQIFTTRDGRFEDSTMAVAETVGWARVTVEEDKLRFFYKMPTEYGIGDILLTNLISGVGNAYGVPGNKDGLTLLQTDNRCFAVWYGYGEKGDIWKYKAANQTQRWWLCSGFQVDQDYLLKVREAVNGTWRCFYTPNEEHCGLGDDNIGLLLTPVGDSFRVTYNTTMGTGFVLMKPLL